MLSDYYLMGTTMPHTPLRPLSLLVASAATTAMAAAVVTGAAASAAAAPVAAAPIPAVRAALVATPPCTNVSVSWRPVSGSRVSAVIALTNRGRTLCTTAGVPSVRVVGTNRGSVLAVQDKATKTPIRMRPGGTLWIPLIWTPCRPGTRSCVVGASVRVVAPRATRAAVAAIPSRLVARRAVAIRSGSLKVGNPQTSFGNALLYWEGGA